VSLNNKSWPLLTRQFKEGCTNVVVDGKDYNIPTERVPLEKDEPERTAFFQGFTEGIRQAREQGELF
jgi:hypothetical protein